MRGLYTGKIFYIEEIFIGRSETFVGYRDPWVFNTARGVGPRTGRGDCRSLPAGLVVVVCHEAGGPAAAHHAGHHEMRLARAAGRQAADREFSCCDLSVNLGSSQRSGEGVQCHGVW